MHIVTVLTMVTALAFLCETQDSSDCTDCIGLKMGQLVPAIDLRCASLWS